MLTDLLLWTVGIVVALYIIGRLMQRHEVRANAWRDRLGKCAICGTHCSTLEAGICSTCGGDEHPLNKGRRLPSAKAEKVIKMVHVNEADLDAKIADLKAKLAEEEAAIATEQAELKALLLKVKEQEELEDKLSAAFGKRQKLLADKADACIRVAKR
jgi:hypothetical protein